MNVLQIKKEIKGLIFRSFLIMNNFLQLIIFYNFTLKHFL